MMGPVHIEKAYNSTDPVFVRPIDYVILENLECTFEHKGHARALMKTSYSQQKY